MGTDPNELIKAAIANGLSQEKSGIDSKTVYRKLAEDTQLKILFKALVWSSGMIFA